MQAVTQIMTAEFIAKANARSADSLMLMEPQKMRNIWPVSEIREGFTGQGKCATYLKKRQIIRQTERQKGRQTDRLTEMT